MPPAIPRAASGRALLPMINDRAEAPCTGSIAVAETELMLDGLTTSNGLGWSPDDHTMYLVDSGPRVIHAFTFDPDQGTIAGGQVLVEVPADIGSPDGLTVDAAGDLWVAIYGGGRVQRYSPAGELREELFTPAEQTTCCAFAGPGLHRLYVTTATEHWTDEQRRAQPAAGLVYAFETDATGGPRHTFVRIQPGGQRWSRSTVSAMDSAGPILQSAVSDVLSSPADSNRCCASPRASCSFPCL